MSQAERVLAEVAELAEERGWNDVVSFAGGLSAEPDGTPLLLAPPEVDVTGLAGRLGQRPRPLEPDVAISLRADRVLLALECGRLLTPAEIEAAAPVLDRPPRSRLLVLVGAEGITNDDDLDLVESAVSRVLLGGSAERRERDPSEHHFLLWADGEAAGFLRGRLERDRDLLDQWLNEPTSVDEALLVARAEHAIALAVAQAEAERAAPLVDERRLAATGAELASIRRRLLRRVESDAATAERQLSASMRSLEQDLLARAGTFLARNRAELTDAERVTAVVDRYIRQEVEGWLLTVGQPILTRAGQTHRDLRDLLEGADWALVNELAPDGGPYPQAVIDAILAAQDVELGEAVPPPAPSHLAGAPAGNRARLDSLLAGGALGVAFAAVLGGGPIGLAAGGLAGATGGRVVTHYLNGRRGVQAAESYAHAVIKQFTAGVLASVGERMRRAAEAAREATGSEFDRVESALRAPAAAPRGGDALPRLAELRRRLAMNG
ncbi:hypothetical protein OG320_01500 [Microbispora sp. NBC_01189]|uniref:hypothetical protein n=1 Tax=Microbispora sp. NBC_01189 TaxID=2903583 RepID=UPI002E0F5E84|nr:hypothetical protein OG320_01500 [Microbispora sp. NBC_01189]